MLSSIWNLFLYQPLVNALAFLVSVVPGGDVGIAVILLTILVKFLLFPLSQSQLRNQAAMAILAPEIDKIKKSGVSQEEQARQTFELYKKHKTNPFAGCLLIIPTIFILIALYRVFIKGIDFENDILYSFITRPEHANMLFLGIIDISKKSLILAVLAGISQYLQLHFMPQPKAILNKESGTPEVDFARSMQTNMKYFFPLLLFFSLYAEVNGVSLTGAVALYFITSNIFAIGQQWYVKKTEKQFLSAESAILNS